MSRKPWERYCENTRIDQETGDARADDQTNVTAVGAQVAAAANVLSGNAVLVNIIPINVLGIQNNIAVAEDVRAIATNTIREKNEVESGSNTVKR